jgi:filamentous hemagglutinin family protein
MKFHLAGADIDSCRSAIGLCILLAIITGYDGTYAQVPPPITSSGLNTQVNAPSNLPGGKVQYDITGGTRPGNGPNLFHSFGEFGVPTNNIANFFNESALSTTNILGRVTGGNPSSLFGTIQTTGFGHANLFLMNPAGFLFGPTATVNVGGMVTFTSADYMKLTDGARFSAIPDAAADALLSIAPVAAFGFLGSNPGAITVQGSQLELAPGQGISLVGGTITVEAGGSDNGTVQAARLSAPGGQVNLVSVASPGEVLYPSLQMDSISSGQSFPNMGTITLSGGSTLDVSSDAAGTVKIRGGQLVMDNATISADTINANGASVAVDIQLTGDLSISTDLNPAITAKAAGSGDAGEVRITSANTVVTAPTQDMLMVIDSHTSDSGRGGNVTLTTGDLTVTGDPFGGITFFINSGTTGIDAGHGGNVTIKANEFHMEAASISTGNSVALQLGEEATGSGGNVTISADSLQFSLAHIVTSAFSPPDPIGEAGNITVTAKDINLDFSLFESAGSGRGGAITIHADQLLASESQIVAFTGPLPGGDVAITAKAIDLTVGSSVVSTTSGDGDAGSIIITATDHLGLIRGSPFDRPSGIFSNSLGIDGTLGHAGDILITTPRLEMTGGGRINTTTATSGRGGNVTIHTTDSISMSGETGGFSPEPLFSLGTIQPSGVFTLSIGGNCTGLCGNAGNVSIATETLTVGSGAQINSGTSSTGRGGDIAINANTISISGTLSNGQPAGMLSRTTGSDPDSGQGGTISLTAGQSVSLSNGASIAASSTGPANAGDIVINSGQSYTSTNSSVTTEAAQASGGNITVTASDLIHLTNSQINASVQGAQTTVGGNIVIDPNFVILQNSQILAQATQGQGGNISIVTNSFLSDLNSLVSASSQFGVSGTVNVQSPISQAGGKIVPLSKTTLETTALLSQRCAALAGGQYSSFVVSGRDALPTEPGGWLASPLMMLSAGEGLSQASAGLARPLDESLVSVRRLPTSGARTAFVTTDWLAGCGS